MKRGAIGGGGDDPAHLGDEVGDEERVGVGFLAREVFDQKREGEEAEERGETHLGGCSRAGVRGRRRGNGLRSWRKVGLLALFSFPSSHCRPHKDAIFEVMCVREVGGGERWDF